MHDIKIALARLNTAHQTGFVVSSLEFKYTVLSLTCRHTAYLSEPLTSCTEQWSNTNRQEQAISELFIRPCQDFNMLINNIA